MISCSFTFNSNVYDRKTQTKDRKPDQPGSYPRPLLQDSQELGHKLSVNLSFSQRVKEERTHLHPDGLHVVADEVAILFVPPIAAVLSSVAHLGVVDACRVTAPPIQLWVTV